MTDAVTSLRVYTGASATTESAAQTGIDLVSVDNALNSPANRSNFKVAPGANSFEKIVAVKLDTVNGRALSGFWVERTGDTPDGVVIKMGVSDTGSTPTASVSVIATTTMVAGRRYIFDANTYDTTGQKTRYLYLQEQTQISATSGAIETQSIEVGWSQS